MFVVDCYLLGEGEPRIKKVGIKSFFHYFNLISLIRRYLVLHIDYLVGNISSLNENFGD